MSEMDEFEKAWAIYEPPFGASPKQISSHFYTLGRAAATRAGTEKGRILLLRQWLSAEVERAKVNVPVIWDPKAVPTIIRTIEVIIRAIDSGAAFKAPSSRPAAPVGEEKAGGDNTQARWTEVIRRAIYENIPSADTTQKIGTLFALIQDIAQINLDIASELQRRGG